MNSDELGEIFNKAISALSSEAVDIIWPEIKLSVQEQVIDVCRIPAIFSVYLHISEKQLVCFR